MSTVGWVLVGLAAGGVAVGGVYYYRKQRALDLARQTQALAAAHRVGASAAEYAKGSGPLSPGAPADQGGTWVQDFDQFAGGVEKLAGAIDRFV